MRTVGGRSCSDLFSVKASTPHVACASVVIGCQKADSLVQSRTCPSRCCGGVAVPGSLPSWSVRPRCGHGAGALIPPEGWDIVAEPGRGNGRGLKRYHGLIHLHRARDCFRLVVTLIFSRFLTRSGSCTVSSRERMGTRGRACRRAPRTVAHCCRPADLARYALLRVPRSRLRRTRGSRGSSGAAVKRGHQTGANAGVSVVRRAAAPPPLSGPGAISPRLEQRWAGAAAHTASWRLSLDGHCPF